MRDGRRAGPARYREEIGSGCAAVARRLGINATQLRWRRKRVQTGGKPGAAVSAVRRRRGVRVLFPGQGFRVDLALMLSGEGRVSGPASRISGSETSSP
jgi:hypothetical protein